MSRRCDLLLRCRLLMLFFRPWCWCMRHCHDGLSCYSRKEGVAWQWIDWVDTDWVSSYYLFSRLNSKCTLAFCTAKIRNLFYSTSFWCKLHLPLPATLDSCNFHNYCFLNLSFINFSKLLVTLHQEVLVSCFYPKSIILTIILWYYAVLWNISIHLSFIDGKGNSQT